MTMTTKEPVVSAKDDDTSDDDIKATGVVATGRTTGESSDDDGVAAANKTRGDDSSLSKEEEDDDEERGNKMMDASMSASDVINSMRSAIEDSLRNIEPPFPLFRRPKQRQRWGDVQVQPHKEWGDIFFDLFYVAGAYNLGNVLREDPTDRGLYYFLALFFPIQSLWQYKMYWDSRFYTPARDMYHAFYELCTLVVLATAVLFIRPVKLLSNPEEHVDLFVYCSSITLGMILVMGRSLETLWLIDDPQPASAKSASKRDAIMYSIMTLFFLIATIFAGVKYYGGDGKPHDDVYHESYSGSSHYGDEADGSSDYDYNTTSDGYYNSTAGTSSEYHADEDHHRAFRFLAGDEYGSDSYGEENNNYSGDVVMGLLLGGFWFNHVLWFLVMMFIIPWQSDGDHRRVTVPMNVDYTIHRYGEWTMLMLGETVLSVCIVGVHQNAKFYKTFYSGMLSISLLNWMHFRSQPHHADDHAIRRKKERGYFFVVLSQLYSAALIVLGASYKMLLYEFNYDAYATEGDDHRLLLFGASNSPLHRWLAGGGESAALRFDKDERQQRIANFFCGSMAAVWLLCDLLILIHKGVKENFERCKDSPAPKLVKLLGLPLFFARIGLIVFMATLSLYATDPAVISFIGLIGVVAQVSLRMVGTALYHEETEEDEILQDILKNGIESEHFGMAGH